MAELLERKWEATLKLGIERVAKCNRARPPVPPSRRSAKRGPGTAAIATESADPDTLRTRALQRTDNPREKHAMRGDTGICCVKNPGETRRSEDALSPGLRMVRACWAPGHVVAGWAPPSMHDTHPPHGVSPGPPHGEEPEDPQSIFHFGKNKDRNKPNAATGIETTKRLAVQV